MIVIMNGKGGVGKDTLCDFAKERYSTMVISAVDKIKEVATILGWDGQKDLKSRKFLSDIKLLSTDYNNFPIRYLEQKTKEFYKTGKDILFVHARDPKDIAGYIKLFPEAKAVLVVRNGFDVKYGNEADDGVYNFPYDYTFDNSKTLNESKELFLALLEKIKNER